MTTSSPVWQIVVSQHHTDSNASAVQELAALRPVSANFDPANPSLLPTGGPPALTVDRRILFTKSVPGDALQDKTFYNMNRGGWPDAKLVPGQYAMIGPREVTATGSQSASTTSNASPPATPKWGGDARQNITLSSNIANGVTYYDQGGTATQKANVLCMIAEMAPPVNWAVNTTDRWRQGMNISEPLASSGNYYPEPPAAPVQGPDDAYCDIDTGGNTLKDAPFEAQAPNPGPANYPLNNATIYPNVQTAKSYTNVRSLYLQRLADPTKIFNAETNPYITVDWASADLTVFNGEEDESSTGTFFNSRERGYSSHPTPPKNANLWYPFTVQNRTATASAGGADHFKHQLQAGNPTLGSLNKAIDDPDAGGLPANSPFPWPAWLDRPFANAAELLLVPWSSPSRFGYEFDRLPTLGQQANLNPYDAPQTTFLSFGQSTNPAPPATGHLPSVHSATLIGGTPQQVSSDLYRLFDLLDTPSPYAGAEKWFNPDTSNNRFSASSTQPAAMLYRPPFNYRSNFRDPGRININTINDSQVWEAIAKQYPFMDPTLDGQAFYNKILQSRQGTGGSGSPTIFGNPFRAAASADLMPDVGGLRVTQPVEATLFRSEPSSNPKAPLFSFSSTATSTSSGNVTRQKLNNTDRNAYFKHQPLAKVMNTLTTNSNCYAVWITVGYFEVEDAPAGFNVNVFPDGLRLAGEVGAQTGDVKRHRGFYLIDRSIPVAFEPGENHNVDRCILTRRMIE